MGFKKWEWIITRIIIIKKQFLRVYILILLHEFLRTKPIEFLQTIKLV
jgi:hypothetical protein